MYALGLIYWLFDREMQPTIDFLNDFFGKKKKLPQIAEANIKVLQAGWNFGETAELFVHRYQVAKADDIPPGKYRRITGNEATAIGLVTASKLCGKDVVYCSYPITPASDVLHYLATMKHYGVKTVQAEDEIAAACGAIGASFAGQLGVTGTSGPGLCLKSEAINLAIITELPMVIVNVQRGGPSTGLPTKTEQSDLLQAVFGRNGDSPLVVIAPQSPSDCFDIAIEAIRLATTHMVPVILLSDGYIANGAEPWRIPDPSTLQKFEIHHPAGFSRAKEDPAFHPYERDEHLVRPWAIPGTEGLEHRIGGLEKENVTGAVAYGPENHQLMTDLRQQKVERVANDIPLLKTEGPDTGDLLVLGWGGTYGAITTAAINLRAKGMSVSSAHLRYLNPMPKNLGDVLKGFKKVLIPELNTGQLSFLIRSKYLVDAKGLNKVAGQPFLVDEIEQAITMMLEDKFTATTATPRKHVVEMNA
jgi:2-oxoglutarate ferredoxin oxidoreductase subunit alpha